MTVKTANVKFNKHIEDKIQSAGQTAPTDRYGVISSYDPQSNTATVILSAPDSDQVGDIVTRVDCPTTSGVQGCAPEPGRMCWVTFNGNKNDSRPLITHFFMANYQNKDYYRQSDARTGISHFMVSM